MDEIICDICNSSIKRKKDLPRHKRSEYCQKVSELLNKFKNENFNKIKLIEEECKKLKDIIFNKDTQIKLLQDKYEDLRKIVEKAATKSTTVKNNYQHNNYLNYISTEPLKLSELSKQLKQIVNCDTVMYDDNDFHDHIVDNLLKDKSGKDKVLCTDINRKNFTYKDENSGELISDPELERLREELKKGTNIKKIRKDLLEKLVTEYEENGCIGIDPYKQFSEIINKLNFGTPFVDHVAKKTYVKRCPTKTNNKIECVNKTFELKNDEEDLEYTEEEYQELLKEFGDNEV
jgi:hypothetical protein